MRQLAVLGLVFLPFTAAAQQPPAEQPRTLSVTGVGTVEREPEKAVVTLAVESEASTARDASERNAELMVAVVAAVRGAGIPERDIRTISYQLVPVYGRPPQDGTPPRIAGYRAMNMVLVNVDSIGRVGRVIDAAIGAGANRVANLSFELRDFETARNQALERAVTAARREAEAVAAAAGQRLGEPLNITTSTMYPEPRPMMMDAIMARQAAVETPIEAGTLTVRATVNIVYKLESR
jgi:uncharacterized protein YggE